MQLNNCFTVWHFQCTTLQVYSLALQVHHSSCCKFTTLQVYSLALQVHHSSSLQFGIASASLFKFTIWHLQIHHSSSLQYDNKQVHWSLFKLTVQMHYSSSLQFSKLQVHHSSSSTAWHYTFITLQVYNLIGLQVCQSLSLQFGITSASFLRIVNLHTCTTAVGIMG